MKKIHELTPCQKEFASEHIKLVDQFLSYRGLPEDEYYDVVIFGYLSAVQNYDEHPGLSRYSFSTIAWRQMNDALHDYYIHANRLKRKAVTISFQKVPENGFSLDELIPCRKNTLQERAADWMYVLEVMSCLTDTEQKMVRLKANGLTYPELAEIFGITPKGISSRFHRMRRRLSGHWENGIYQNEGA